DRGAPEQTGIESCCRTECCGKGAIGLKAHGAHGKPAQPCAKAPGKPTPPDQIACQAFIIAEPRHPLGACCDLPGPGLEQTGARRQRANADQVKLLYLPVVALVLAQLQFTQFDLCPERKTVEVVEQVMVRHAQTVLGEGAISTVTDTQLQGSRAVAVLGQQRPLNIQTWRRVAVDRL